MTQGLSAETPSKVVSITLARALRRWGLKMSDDLFELVGDDLNHLGDLIAGSLNSSSALHRAKRLLRKIEQSGAAALLDQIKPGDANTLKTLALLSIAGDCLRRVSQAILADGEVDDEEMDLAYTIASPLANYLAKSVDRYSHYADLEPQELAGFLDEFNKDSDVFGGGPECPSAMLGGFLSAVVCILTGDLDAIDRYEHVTITILDGIMRIGGMDTGERAALKSTREYFQALRNWILHNQTNQQAGSVTSVSKPRKQMGDSAFAIEEDADILASINNPSEKPEDPQTALQTAMADLESLIGLPGVKDEMKRLMSFLKIQQERRKHGLRESGQTLHFVFTGNPGTGKTTVARIVSKILCGFGLLKTTKVVECDRSDLVGGYLGQTAIKTDEVVSSALDGVLFIDEAYSLSDAFGHDMYGQEAVNTLLKRMEDHRDKLVVIAAGYPKPMEKFLRTNPGLESRFTRFIRFEDYEVPDLSRIFDKFCKDAEYSLTPACRAHACLLFILAYRQRDERFGNARFVRNIFEQAISRHSQRLASLPDAQIDKHSLITLDAPDIPFEAIPDFDIRSIDLQEAKWDCECPGCGNASKGGLKFLGQRVSCKCGQKFTFPWWSIDPATVKGIAPECLALERSVDRRGQVEVARQEPSQVSPVTTPQVSQHAPEAWKPDPRRGATLLEEGVSYLKKGQCDLAIKCFETAISLDWPNSDPAKQPYYLCRAKAYEMQGNDSPLNALTEYNEGAQNRRNGHYQASIESYLNSINLDPAFAWSPNNLAWLYATCVEAKVRNGKKAIQYATVACEIAKWRCWSFIDTLSAGYAESGDFENAVIHAERALTLAPRESQDEVQENIKRYRTRKPLHLNN